MKTAFLAMICLVLVSAALLAGDVFVSQYQGIIGPISSRYIEKAIGRAEEAEAECLVILLDTPGGLDDAMRDIVKAELNAGIPVVVFVHPKGARAASAGVFITLAAHIAAMAPGTNIGAAHPVAIGKKMDRVMTEKVTNDAVAYIQSIAEERGRNGRWAERAVRQSVSASSEDALQLNIINVVAKDLDDLLEQIDGMEVSIKDESRILNTRNALTYEIHMTFREQFLVRITNPNIAYILLTLGMYGLVYEFTHPGAIFPGVAGGVCLILAFLALQTLPVNYAGIALIVMGIIMLFLETRTPTNGPLTVGGIASMILGSVMLFDTDAPFLRVSWSVILPVVLFTAAFFLFLVYMTVRAMKKKPTTGTSGLVGETAEVKSAISPTKPGSVFIHGEFWDAIADEKIKIGEEVEVTEVKGMRLIVKRKR
jgi:membrane-bound serine protease (ClpP class)